MRYCPPGYRHSGLMASSHSVRTPSHSVSRDPRFAGPGRNFLSSAARSERPKSPSGGPSPLKHKKRAVLHIFGQMNRGGAELRTIDLLRQDALSQFEFHFATLSGRRGTLDEEITRLGGYVHPCRLAAPGF